MKGDFEYCSQANHGNSFQISFLASNLPVLRPFDFIKINDDDKSEMSLRKEAQEKKKDILDLKEHQELPSTELDQSAPRIAVFILGLQVLTTD